MSEGVFVSYSHQDMKIVEQIVTVLKENSGEEVWYDHKLRGGENYFSVIANQIIKNKYFVFIVSDNSVNSDWCLRELEFAASEHKIIIAIWLDNISISPRVKLIIQNTHYINWFSATNQLFSEAVEKAFNNECLSLPVSHSGNMKDEEFLSAKYFLSVQDIKKINELLNAEKNGKYSVCFVPENANLLGMAYELGAIVEVDLKKAQFYYKISRYYQNPNGQYLHESLKRQTEPKGKYSPDTIIDAAEHGSVLALTELGDNYYEGKNGFAADKVKAYEYYRKAADLNGAAAMYYMAYGHRWGEVVEQDFEIAYMYALKAREFEFPRSYRILAFMYKKGEYVQQDMQEAIRLFGEAIKRGDYLSYCYQGDAYGELEQFDKEIELYQKAVYHAEQDEIKSGTPFYRMGYVYKFGEGVDVDSKKGIEFYLEAAKRGNKNAQKYVVSDILALEDDKEKLAYLHMAFKYHCDGAAYNLGQMECKDQKTNKERLYEKAVQYYKAGAELGDIDCVVALVLEYSFIMGNGKTREDRLEAIKWFQFFFANVQNDYLEHMKRKNILTTYYYAYALELDYDPDVNMPDREFVLFYIKKCVEESPMHIGRIAGFAVDGYLFPQESDSGLVIDVAHAEELLLYINEHLKDYYEYTKNSELDITKWQDCLQMINKGYLFISECYKKGKHVEKNRTMAEKYQRMAKKIGLLYSKYKNFDKVIYDEDFQIS